MNDQGALVEATPRRNGVVVRDGQWNGVVALWRDGIRMCKDFGVGRDVSWLQYEVRDRDSSLLVRSGYSQLCLFVGLRLCDHTAWRRRSESRTTYPSRSGIASSLT
jgi:hypothetical protein